MDMRIYHTFVYCIETDKYHPFFSRPVNSKHRRSSFWVQLRVTLFQTPLCWSALNKGGFGKNRNFMPISCYILETVENSPTATTVRLIGSHRYPIDRFQFRWSWVTLKGGMRRAQFSRRMTLKRTWRFFEIIDIISNIIIGKKSKKFHMCAIDAGSK